MMNKDLDVTHVDNIPWYEADLPSRWHRCQAQTVAFDYRIFRTVQRCACGAIRFDRERWQNRNETRNAKRAGFWKRLAEAVWG